MRTTPQFRATAKRMKGSDRGGFLTEATLLLHALSGMDLSSSFDVEDDADVVVALLTPASSKRPTADETRSYSLHKIILKNQSPVLKARLEGAYADTPHLGKGQQRLVLELQVEECDLEAMHVVLRSLYKASLNLEQREDKLLLLKACRLARYYCLPDDCMAAIAAPLQAMKPGEVDISILAAVYGPAAGLLGCDALSKFLALCKERLLALFGDVPAVLTSQEAREQFDCLPYEAVLAWLKEDDLKVHSENCVVLLLSAWVNGQGCTCSKEQLEELAHHVRVQHLTPSYLHCVLPHLGWFKGCGGMASLPQLLYRNRRLATATSLVWEGPPTWLSSARGRASLPCSLKVSFDFKAADLQDEDWFLSESSPDNLYYLNGFFFGVQFVKRAVSSTSGPEAVSLGAYGGINVTAMRGALGAWDSRKQAADFSLGLRIGSESWQSSNVLAGNPCGWGDFLDRSGATIQEVVAPFLVQGKLSASATFTQVN